MKPQEKGSAAIKSERALISIIWSIWLLAFAFCWTMVLLAIFGRTWEWPFFLYLLCGLGLIWLRALIEAWGLNIVKRLEEEQQNQK